MTEDKILTWRVLSQYRHRTSFGHKVNRDLVNSDGVRSKDRKVDGIEI